MKAPAGDRRARLREMLADLKMPGALEAVDGILAQADSGAVTAGEAIEDLLSAQIVLRNNRRLQAAMRSSRLPAVKTLDQFDFSFQRCGKRQTVSRNALENRQTGFPQLPQPLLLLTQGDRDSRTLEHGRGGSPSKRWVAHFPSGANTWTAEVRLSSTMPGVATCCLRTAACASRTGGWLHVACRTPRPSRTFWLPRSANREILPARWSLCSVLGPTSAL